MADDVYNGIQEPEPHLPPPPPKNFVLFSMNGNEGFFPKGILEGEMGPLPLLMAVNVGYDPENEDPFMYPYESHEILFAYKTGAQKRVLIQDRYKRTYSLPVQSKMEFCVKKDASEELTVAEIVRRYQLPLFGVEFARPDPLDFVLGKQKVVDSTYFGSLTLTRVYEEPFLYCLSISGSTPRKIPRVLPQNLKGVWLAPVIKVKGMQDSASKLREFRYTYAKFAQELDYHDDPFFQELALVSEGPQPLDGPIEPYIDDTTFIRVRYNRHHIPDLTSIPVVPPRIPLTRHANHNLDKCRSQELASVAGFEKQYTSLRPKSTEEHVYSVPLGLAAGEVADAYTRLQSVALKTQPESQAVVTIKEVTAQPPQLPPRSVDSARVTSPKGCHVNQDRKLHRPPLSVPEVQTSCVSLTLAPALSLEPPLPHQDELESLTVKDVKKKLRALGMGKYVSKFQAKLIDGKLLQILAKEPDILEKEFKMTRLDFLKLRAYVREGHIPQQQEPKKTLHVAISF